jgi:hypothetical protein
MARRGFLDYVLGGAVGGLEGLAQKRAAEEERKRMADAAAMDQARFLISSGFRIAPPAYDTEDPAARSILPPLEMPSAAPPPAARASGALSAALNRGMGVDTTQPSLSRPSFGADPLALDSRTTRMTEVLGRGQEARAAQEAIAASVTLPGGQKVRFNAPESASGKAQREYEDAMRTERGKLALSATQDVQKQKELESKFVADVAKLVKTGVPESQAVQTLMLKGTYGDLFTSPAEKARILLDREKFNLDVAEFNFEKTKTTGGQIGTGLDYTTDLQKINEFLPSVDPKTGKTVPAKRELSGAKLLTVQQGGLGGSLVGQAGTLAASMGGADLGNEQIYNTTASGIATAFAIQEQRGRNVSDRDVKNRIEQVTLTPTEVGNLEVQALKANRLRQWINALSSNRIQQINPGETGFLPAIETTRSPSASPSGGFPSYEEWAKSRKK